MKVLLSWLREFAPLEGSAEELGDVMSDLDMAVEELTTFSYPGIIVARVFETRPHPDADRVQRVDVDTGDGEALQIVCGAPNVGPGQRVAVATIGTVLPGDFKIKKSKIRGVESRGMICSVRELDLGDEHDGIWVLPEKDGVVTLHSPVGEAAGQDEQGAHSRVRPRAWNDDEGRRSLLSQGALAASLK